MRYPVVAFISMLAVAAWLQGRDQPSSAPATAPAPTPARPVPDAAAIKQASALVEELYGPEVRAAKTPEQRKDVVRKLLDTAGEEQGARRYALLAKARDLAMEAGDIDGCETALDQLAASFEVDGVKVRAEAFAGLARNARVADDRLRLCEDLSAVVRAAVAADQFDSARTAAEAEQRIARMANNPDAMKRANADAQMVREMEDAYAGVKKALPALAAKPDDPDANLTVGTYRCLLKGDWKQGLPLLALGNDGVLKTLAEQESAGAAAADGQVKLGDGWWDAGQKMTGMAKAGALGRAGTWYEMALPRLMGLEKSRVEKRLAELSPINKERGKPTFLSDLREEDVRVGMGSFGRNGDLGYEGGKIVVGGVPSPHGLSTHPPDDGSAHVAYRLTKRYSVFTATAALNDGPASDTPLVFRVLGDGKELWHSAPLSSGTAEPCRIDITGMTKLELQVDCRGSFRFAHAVWVEPIIK